MPTQAELDALHEELRTKTPKDKAVCFIPEIPEGVQLDGLNVSGGVALQKGGTIVVASIEQDPNHVYLFLDTLDKFPPDLIVKRDLTTQALPRARGDLMVTWSKKPGEKKSNLFGSMLSKVHADPGTFIGCFRFKSCDEAFSFIQFLVIKCFFPVSFAEVSSGAAVAPK